MTIQELKLRFGIIGGSPALERAMDIAMQVAPTDLSVLINGESGTGKEVFPQIIHQLSARKHGQYIAVNCGAIPEGTIDSELFGHEKGSFTGAHEARKGYFEVADGGTIFLDEVAEMPLSTQARLLRVLETGEFIKVGSSKVLKTNVRVVAATNVNLQQAIERGKFREDLYYRLNTVPIILPPLRERRADIHLLFRKFATDFASRYRMPVIKLDTEAEYMLNNYYWHGNVRQLKNVTEQISIIEKTRDINAEILQRYLPNYKAETNNMPVLMRGENTAAANNEIIMLYAAMREMRQELNDMKELTLQLLNSGGAVSSEVLQNNAQVIQKLVRSNPTNHYDDLESPVVIHQPYGAAHNGVELQPHIVEVEESLSLQEKEIDLIKKALNKHRGKRKYAAEELGISERTLYRKINEYDIKE